MLESLKKDVVAMAKRAQKEGLCKHLSGNLSARDPETGYVVITPTQVDRELLTARDMVVLDLDANVIENESGLRGSHGPSSRRNRSLITKYTAGCPRY